MHERMLASDEVGLLLLCWPDIELLKLLNDQIPVVLLCGRALLVFHAM